jgi:membrane associated rhomboid family serine protease
MAYLKEPERQPFVRIPVATAGLILILVAAHVARVTAPLERSNAILANYAFYPARYSHAFLVAHGANHQSFWDRAIPFVSYIFLHDGFAHLAVNCIWLLPFGALVARRFGALLFFAFFLVCGIAGALSQLMTNWGSMQSMIGASAAISGLMAAGFRIIAPVEASNAAAYSSAISGDHPPPLAPAFSERILLWSALWVLINVFAGLTGLGGGPAAGIVAWQAHIGGYVAGLLLAGPFDMAARRLRA